MMAHLPGKSTVVSKWWNQSVSFHNIKSRREKPWTQSLKLQRVSWWGPLHILTHPKSSSSSLWAGQTRPSRPPPSAWRTCCSERSPGPRQSRTTWYPGPPGGCTWCVQTDQSFWPNEGKRTTTGHIRDVNDLVFIARKNVHPYVWKKQIQNINITDT